MILGESEVTVEWNVPDNVQPGVYRLGHRGYWHTIIRGNIYYEGWSQPFNVINEGPNIQPDIFEIPAMSNSGNSLQTPFKLLSRWL